MGKSALETRSSIAARAAAPIWAVGWRSVVSGTGWTAYAAGKAAIVQMTRSLALELAPDGINVVNIAPGLVRMPLTEPGLDARRVPLARAAEPHPGQRV